MSQQKDPEIDLEEYFSDDNQFLYIRRKELKSILAYLVDKKLFAESLMVFDEELQKEMETKIREVVQAEMGEFMLALQQPPEEASRIIVPEISVVP